MKLKTISIGDIHGRWYWKGIDPKQYDKIIFVGDYVDQFPPMTDTEIQSNLLDIIQFKKDNPDKVILLLGNHDIQYLFLEDGFGCSGFRPSMAESLYSIFTHNKDLFQAAFQIGNYIWTHAGISTIWYDYNKNVIEKTAEKFETANLADTFNHMLWMNSNRLLHQVGRCRGGAYPCGGITWADRRETSTDRMPGLHQIVGHTPIKQITTFGDQENSITYIDVLNEVYYAEQDRLNAKKFFAEQDEALADTKPSAKAEYDKMIKEMFPEFKEEKEVLTNLTKFYELEIEHSV